MEKQTCELSVVTTVYKSLIYLEEFLTLVLASVKDIGVSDYEIIFVLDGITDNSKEFLLEKQKEIKEIKIIELSRNFGHHIAIYAGLKESRGESIFLIDCDLEVSPRLLEEFIILKVNTKADVVYAVQEKRKGRFIERKLGGLFWKLFNLMSNTKIPHNPMTERLMNRNYLNALLSMNDKNVFMAGLMYWVGFNQVPHPVTKKLRKEQSTYSFTKRFDLLIEAITSFSEKPLKLLFKSGCVLTIISICFALYQVINKILYPETILLGFTSIIISISLTLGILISSIGVLGLYVSKLFNEVKDRPLYIIKKIF